MSDARELKFRLLASGLAIRPATMTRLVQLAGAQGLSSADYASTSGIILKLDDDVWVNAPYEQDRPSFVDGTPYALGHDDGGFLVEGEGLASRARLWPQPAYHGTSGPHGTWNNYVVSHTDRARLSPIRGCAMMCDFCNIPFDDPISVYALKPIDTCLEALRVAVDDAVQPAHHILISGGTPKPKDVWFHQELYVRVIQEFPTTPVDIMMAPIKDVLRYDELREAGVNELSINLEVFDQDIAASMMRNKHHQGRDYYLSEIERASEELGPLRVRSMLMVGLEPLASTLAGVRAIAERGGVPVLSPFRPDPVTPLAGLRPPALDLMHEAYERGREIARAAGSYLGPDCPPCTHNTLGFGEGRDGDVRYRYAEPVLL